jgi:hypothetical protein
MFRTRTDLSVRADRVKLPGARDPVWKDVLYSEADVDAWRIVEVSSLDGKPFDIELIWSAANGSGANAFVTVPHATRICVFARTVQVRVKNLDRGENAVGVTVADGYAETRNQFEVRVDRMIEAEEAPEPNVHRPRIGPDEYPMPTRIHIPPFAQRAWVEPSQEGVEGFIMTIDGDNRKRGVTRLDKQPDDGILVGGAKAIDCFLGPPVDFRVVFSLGI